MGEWMDGKMDGEMGSGMDRWVAGWLDNTVHGHICVHSALPLRLF